MNGNVAAAHSGTLMAPTNKHNLDLRLDLNLMSIGNSSTPCTPNGKIKVFMNNIASGVTKAKSSSSEWRRCRLDAQNCISLGSVLETFNSSISEEQAWAICFGFIGCIRTLTGRGFKFKCNGQFEEPEFVLYLHRDGYVHEKTILRLLGRFDESASEHRHDTNGTTNGSANDSTIDSAIGSANGSLTESDGTLNGNSRELTNGRELINGTANGTANGMTNGTTNGTSNCQHHYDEADLANGVAKELSEQELLMRLGLALFDALDYNKDSNEELLISSELENLIAKITLEEADGSVALTIDEIDEICRSRKASQCEDKTDEYYTSICKTLVIETIELSTFLQTIYEGTQMRERMNQVNSSNKRQDCTDGLKLGNDEPLKMHLAQWAKLWMQVLDEFRNGKRKLRKVETSVTTVDGVNGIPPPPGTPPVVKAPSVGNLSRMNAHNLIMEYIRSRPALMPASNRKLGPVKPLEQSLIEQLHDAIRRQDVKLKPTSRNPRNELFTPVVGRVVERSALDDVKSLCDSAESSPAIRRKLIKADIDYIDWDQDDRGIKYSSLF